MKFECMCGKYNLVDPKISTGKTIRCWKCRKEWRVHMRFADDKHGIQAIFEV